jgi:hypothetical protein
MGLRKFLKKAVKLGGKLTKPILAQTPVGRLALLAQQRFKSLGASLKAARLGKIQPASVRAAVEKVDISPARRLSVPRSLARSSGKGSTMTQKRKTTTGKGRRVPPAGGLDLRAMAQAWRAAGKPGTWRDWIRTNQIRKAG